MTRRAYQFLLMLFGLTICFFVGGCGVGLAPRINMYGRQVPIEQSAMLCVPRGIEAKVDGIDMSGGHRYYGPQRYQARAVLLLGRHEVEARLFIIEGGYRSIKTTTSDWIKLTFNAEAKHIYAIEEISFKNKWDAYIKDVTLDSDLIERYRLKDEGPEMQLASMRESWMTSLDSDTIQSRLKEFFERHRMKAIKWEENEIVAKGGNPVGVFLIGGLLGGDLLAPSEMLSRKAFIRFSNTGGARKVDAIISGGYTDSIVKNKYRKEFEPWMNDLKKTLN